MDSIFFVLLRLRSVLHSWYKTLCTCMLAGIITPFTLSAGATRTTHGYYHFLLIAIGADQAQENETM